MFKKHTKIENEAEFFGTEKIWKILLKISPPVMLSQLVMSMYNIVDSLFVGQYSGHGLTALSVIYPLQLIITALAVGTGVGVNTYMARLYARGEFQKAKDTAGTGTMLAILMWAVFASLSVLIMKPYIRAMANAPEAIEYAYQYGMVVCVGSLGTFLEGIWSKVHQSHGNMVVPMIAQLSGALTNILLDWIFIFGMGKLAPMGVLGAAVATVIGQFVSAIIVGIKGSRNIPKPSIGWDCTKRIYKLALPSIVMQMMYVVYILVLNAVLTKFCDEAVTVLGLYYKLQTFFFIPMFGLQTCIVPVISYNYAQRNYDRAKRVMNDAMLITAVFMLIGIVCFEFFPRTFIGLFSKDEKVLSIGQTAFRIIGASFIPAVFSLMLPMFFQAIGKSVPSIILSLIRQVVGLMPLFYAFSFIGLDYTWIAFPVAETLTTIIGLILYIRQLKEWKGIKHLEGDVPEYVNERVANRSQEANIDENAAVLCPNDADSDETLSSKTCENVKNVR